MLSQTILLSDSSSEDENEDRPCSHEDLQAMLKVHKHQKRHQARYYQNPQLRKYMYYSTGLLSNYDKFPEHHKSIVGPKKKISKEQKKIEKKVKGLCFLARAKKDFYAVRYRGAGVSRCDLLLRYLVLHLKQSFLCVFLGLFIAIVFVKLLCFSS